MSDQRSRDVGEEQSPEQRRDAMLLRLLKTPPQPRPKRERSEKPSAKGGQKRTG